MSQAQTTIIDEENWMGPYDCKIAFDKSVSDNCGSGLNNTNAFSGFDHGDRVALKVEYNNRAEVYSNSVKKTGNSAFSTLPIEKRRSLGVSPGDTVKLFINQTEEKDGPDAAVIGGKDVYHRLKDTGGSYCGQIALDDGGYPKTIPTKESFIDEEKDLCQRCRRLSEEQTLAELHDLVMERYELSGENIMTKENMQKLLEQDQ